MRRWHQNLVIVLILLGLRPKGASSSSHTYFCISLLFFFGLSIFRNSEQNTAIYMFLCCPWCRIEAHGYYSKLLYIVIFRLLIIFCVINTLNYVDRGAIASNGVNGSLATCTDSGICTAGSGIQYALLPSLTLSFTTISHSLPKPFYYCCC